jgi:hypothetical protein
MRSASSQRSVFSGLGESFLAVVGGNVLYFLVAPHMPAALQHELFRPDAGLAVDFLFCAGVFGVIRLVRRVSARHSE